MSGSKDGRGAVMMVGLSWERIVQGLDILASQPRGQARLFQARRGLFDAERVRQGAADHHEPYRLRESRRVAKVMAERVKVCVVG